MPRLLTAFIARLDSAYRGQSHFSGLRARLLAAFVFLMFAYVPCNLAKLLWVGPPQLALRIAVTTVMGLSAALALRWLLQGRLEQAGGGMVLGAILPAYTLVLLAPDYIEPVGLAVQLFVLGNVFLLLALVFASRAVALLTLVVVLGGNLLFYQQALAADPLAGSLRYAASTLRRDGLVAIIFVFCLGLALMRMIAAAHRRGEESLRATQALNENLERLVAARTRELEVTTRLAQEAARAKGDFLANMSHEIRTPLNGIIGLADLLGRRRDLPPEVTEQVRIVAESGDLLLRLLGDILDFSKIEAGQLTLEMRSFELAPLAEDCVALVAPRARQAGIGLELKLAPGLPAKWEGDSFRLRQVLLNLLSNGVKFTPSGGHVRLTAALDEPATGTPMLRFEVRDTGIGMDAATLNRLFERFTQADTSTTRRYGGTGLGLAISSRLVTLMGGELSVESVPGQGSVFRFTLPPRPGDGATKATPMPTAAPAAPLGLRVLVVEDNAVNRKIIAAQLDLLGCTCTLAEDGEAGLAALQTGTPPDAVLMDCHMPRLDGWEATRRLRGWANDPAATDRQRQIATLPIIALTAAALPEEQERCREIGMNDFVAKPVKLDTLRRALQPHAAPAKTSNPVAEF